MRWLGVAQLVSVLITACSAPLVTSAPSLAPSSPGIASPTLGAITPPSTQGPAVSAARPSETPSPGIPSAHGSAPAVAPHWSAIGLSGGPSARSDHTWTIDDTGDSAYLFGGLAADGPSNELWRYDLVAGTWTQIKSAGNNPEGRFGHTATWVPNVGLVVWSGQGESAFFDDLWAFKPATDSWSQLPSSGAVPAARYGSCAALGPDGRLWISHGFTEDSGRFSDTLAYDFDAGAWQDMTPSAAVPIKRCLHDCFWSADGKRLILYGGQTTNVPALDDIWAFEPASAAWHQGPSSAAPARQLYALATLDQGGGLVFGGAALDRSYLADAWMIDGQTLEFSPITVDSTPSARSGATLIADSKRARVLLFAGIGTDGPLADLWQLEGLP